MVDKVRAAIRRQLATHPSFALAIASALRRAGDERRAGRIARAAGVVAPTVLVHVPFHAGATFRLHSFGGRDQVAVAAWFDGSRAFERPLPDALAILARGAVGTFLDVGANTGFYALVACNANPALKVHAFEPFPPVYALLERNLELNGNPPAVKPWQLAIGAASGTALLYVPVQDHGLVETSCSLDPSFKPTHSEVVEVSATTLDDFVVRNGIDDVAIVKIDVEGYEDKVLRGAAETLRRFRPYVIFELLDRADAQAIEALRVELDYASFRLRDGTVAPEERVGFDPAAWNHLMVPRERVSVADAFRRALRAAAV